MEEFLRNEKLTGKRKCLSITFVYVFTEHWDSEGASTK
jgi:hypothetical protein